MTLEVSDGLSVTEFQDYVSNFPSCRVCQEKICIQQQCDMC